MALRKRLKPDVVLEVAADWFRYPVRDLLGDGRSKTRSIARQVVMWILIDDGYSCSEVAEIFDKDKTTVSKNVRALRARMKTDHRLSHHAAGVLLRAQAKGGV